MYKQIKVKSPHKIYTDDLFSGEKKAIHLIANQIIIGRIDNINGKYWLTFENGLGAIIDRENFEIIE